MLDAERERLLRLRDGGAVADEVLRAVMVALDVEESMLERLEEEDVRRADESLRIEPLGGACEHLQAAVRRSP